MQKFERPELDLRAALRIVRQNLALIIIPAVLLTGLQLGMALKETPLYSASTELLLQAKSTDSLGSGVTNANSAQGYDTSRVLSTEIRVLQSEAIAKRAVAKLGYSAGVSGSSDGNSDIITVNAVDADPERAAKTANTYAAEYVSFRRERSVRDLTDASRELKASAEKYQQEIDAVNLQLADPVNVSQPARTALELKRDGLIRQQQTYTARIDGLTLDASLKTGGASILTPAYASGTPFSPRPLRSAVLGLFLGLMLGLGLAFLREFLDDRIKIKDDVSAMAGGKPILGAIPFFKMPKRRARHAGKRESMERHPTYVSVGLPIEAAEAYRSLRSSIQFVAVDRPIRIVQITSAKSGEGKTTTVVNLARTLAQSGLSVMVVDGDLRHPKVHEFFSISNEIGLSTVLSGARGIAVASQFIDGTDDITVLPSGPIPPNPAELLGSERAKSVLRAMLDHYDIVIVDGPPVLPVVDALVLSQLVDATIVVARVGKSKRDELATTMEMLSQANAPVVGFVLNSTPRPRRYGYGNNAYGYGAATVNPRKRAQAPTTKTSPVWVPDESPLWNATDGLAVRSRPFNIGADAGPALAVDEHEHTDIDADPAWADEIAWSADDGAWTEADTAHPVSADAVESTDVPAYVPSPVAVPASLAPALNGFHSVPTSFPAAVASVAGVSSEPGETRIPGLVRFSPANGSHSSNGNHPVNGNQANNGTPAVSLVRERITQTTPEAAS